MGYGPYNLVFVRFSYRRGHFSDKPLREGEPRVRILESKTDKFLKVEVGKTGRRLEQKLDDRRKWTRKQLILN